MSGGCTKGFLSADLAMRKSEISSGTTAVLALVGPDDIVVANCGDSRSVLRCAGARKRHFFWGGGGVVLSCYIIVLFFCFVLFSDFEQGLGFFYAIHWYTLVYSDVERIGYGIG